MITVFIARFGHDEIELNLDNGTTVAAAFAASGIDGMANAAARTGMAACALGRGGFGRATSVGAQRFGMARKQCLGHTTSSAAKHFENHVPVGHLGHRRATANAARGGCAATKIGRCV